MRGTFFSLAAVSIVIALGSTSAWAQATAEISGAARDQSGAALPGVEITATQTDTGVTRTAVTNETGSYVLPNLPLGPYRLEATLPGFRTHAQTGIVLQVSSSPVINVVLEVGQVAETVEVQANAALVETRSSALGSVIENARVLELPLNGRNVTDLISLAGGAVRQAGSSVNFSTGESPMLAIAGSAGYGIDFTLDGADHMNYLSGTTMTMPFPDAMQEFKVESSGATAQRRSSAAVAAVTKSGTNEVHGDFFEFVRNDLFNARQYFATKNSTLKRNQFGGTLGGPIVKNKLFYFGGYQGTTLRSDPADTRTFIPTAAMMAGDWTAFTSPACNSGRQINLRAPFVNNRIDPALYNKQASFIVNWKGYLPFPKTDNPCGEITYGKKSQENDGIWVGKLDFQQSAKHSLFGRVIISTQRFPNPESFNTNLLQDTGYTNGTNSSYTLGSTYIVSSTTVQAFRLAVNRNATLFYNIAKGKLFNWCDIGVKIYCEPAVTRINNMTITGAFSMPGGGLSGIKYVGNNYSMNDDVSLVRGSHQLALGVNASHGRENILVIYSSVHQFTFDGSATGLGLADFMLGRPSQLFTGRTNTHRERQTNVSLYAADSWKVNTKFVLNYGVRWEPYLPEWTEAIYNFDYDRFLKGIKTTQYVNAPAGLYYRGDPGFPENGIKKQWRLFAPRLGLAWDVNGDGRTSVRASYALGYVVLPGTFRQRYSGTGPWGGRVTLSSPPGGLENPYQDIPGGDIFPYVVDKNSPYPPYGWVYTQAYDLPATYMQTWNLSLQREIAKGWLASASYVGSNQMHIRGSFALNPAIYIPGGPCTLNGVTYNPCSTVGNTDQRRKFSLERPEDGAKIGYVAQADDGGKQFYNGMILSLERRISSGVTLNGNYTLSHCIGPYASLYDSLSLQPSDTYTDINNRNADQGNCDSDRRQVFNFTSVAEAPKFSNSKLRVLASGWRLSGIYRMSAGSPLNIVAGTDRALNGITNQRANQVADSPFGDRSAAPLSRYLNPASFSLPALGTRGNISRNSVRGPATWSFDLSLSRGLRFRESQRMEFRAEAYNVTNSFRPSNPSANIGSNTFGVIRTAADTRILQFALKYVF